MLSYLKHQSTGYSEIILCINDILFIKYYFTAIYDVFHELKNKLNHMFNRKGGDRRRGE